MNEHEVEKRVRELAHQMFTDDPELWNHQGVVRQYLRLALLGDAALRAERDEWKRRAEIAAHVKAEDADSFDWAVLKWEGERDDAFELLTDLVKLNSIMISKVGYGLWGSIYQERIDALLGVTTLKGCPLCDIRDRLRRAEKLIDDAPIVGTSHYDDVVAQLVNDISSAVGWFQDYCDEPLPFTEPSAVEPSEAEVRG